MSKNLLIVESPGKISKLKSFLSSDWMVEASIGHIRDLPRKSLGINKHNNYELVYEVQAEKTNIISNLRAKIKQVGHDHVYLATDEDREGEAIAYHISDTLGLDTEKVKRVTFNELTKVAVLTAIANPRTINMQLVRAQETRRAIDRYTGYLISPLLFKKFDYKDLSAGRVQSVALKLVCDQENRIKSFTPQFSYTVYTTFTTPNGDKLKAKFQGRIPQTENDCKNYLNASFVRQYFVNGIDKETFSKQLIFAFSTSTLQQQAYNKLKFPIAKTMEIAQRLYEKGHITYMRTDSIRIAEPALDEIEVAVTKFYGIKYHQRRTVTYKDDQVPEAHEAIRPTDLFFTTSELSEDERALYNLIYTRTLASQMQPAIYEKSVIHILDTNKQFYYIAQANVLLFDGYLKAYQDDETDDDKEEDEEINVHPISLIQDNDEMKPYIFSVKDKITSPPKRFDPSSLVKILTKYRIGRPSTYEAIIKNNTIKEYIVIHTSKGDPVELTQYTISLENNNTDIHESKSIIYIGSEKDKFFPTKKGKEITNFLKEHFSEIIDYNFTIRMENEFDSVAKGINAYVDCVKQFEDHLSNLIVKADEAVQSIQKEEPDNSSVYLGIFDGQPVKKGTGKYGSFILYKDKFYNFNDKKVEDIDLAFAIELIKKNTNSSEKAQLIKKLGSYSVFKTDKGLVITDSVNRCYMPNELNIDTLTEKECKNALHQYLTRIKKN